MMIRGGVYDDDDENGVYDDDDDDEDDDVGSPGLYSKMITDDDTRKGKRERLEIRDATDHYRNERSTELGSKPE
jgi:hypothetical protein